MDRSDFVHDPKIATVTVTVAVVVVVDFSEMRGAGTHARSGRDHVVVIRDLCYRRDASRSAIIPLFDGMIIAAITARHSDVHRAGVVCIEPNPARHDVNVSIVLAALVILRKQ